MPVKAANLEDEYVKNKQLKKGDVEVLRNWTEKQPYLPEITEFHLILFLHSCYYNLEVTKETIEKCFVMKTIYSNFLTNRNINSAAFKNSLDNVVIANLARRSPEGYPLIFAGLMDTNVTRFDFNSLLKIFDLHLRLFLEEEGTCEGVVFLISFDGFNVGHLEKISVVEIKHFLAYVQEALPVRVQRVHLINAQNVVKRLIALARPFLKKEILKKIHFHKDIWDDFYKFVPQIYLPLDYGGEDDNLKIHQGIMKAKILSNVEFFMKDESLVADLSKKIEEQQDPIWANLLKHYERFS